MAALAVVATTSRLSRLPARLSVRLGVAPTTRTLCQSRLINETTHEIRIDDLNLSTTGFSIGLLCSECDGEGLSWFSRAFSTPEAGPGLTKFFNVAVGALGPSIVSLINTKLATFLGNSTPPAADPWVPDFLVVMCFGVVCLFVVLSGLSWAATARWCCYRSRSRSRSPSAAARGHLDSVATNMQQPLLEASYGAGASVGSKPKRAHKAGALVCDVTPWGAAAFLLGLAVAVPMCVTNDRETERQRTIERERETGIRAGGWTWCACCGQRLAHSLGWQTHTHTHIHSRTHSLTHSHLLTYSRQVHLG